MIGFPDMAEVQWVRREVEFSKNPGARRHEVGLLLLLLRLPYSRTLIILLFLSYSATSVFCIFQLLLSVKHSPIVHHHRHQNHQNHLSFQTTPCVAPIVIIRSNWGKTSTRARKRPMRSETFESSQSREGHELDLVPQCL